MEPDRRREGVSGVESALTYTLPADAYEAVDAPEALTLPFGVFYEQRRDRVARALALTLGDADLAAEAVDEAMVRAYQRWDRIGTFTDPAGWVYRVGLNWATSVRHRLRRAPTPPVDREDQDMGPLSEPDVAAALLELPVHQRAVVVCRFYLGFSEMETSRALRTKPGTVKSRLHRALRHLEVRLAHLSPKEHR
jgi:DNA-directed RNA polymerase specialized sigma24 family protein